MTIKIKASVIWLEERDLRGFLSKRCSDRESKYYMVRDSDWRKLMKLVRAAEIHSCFEHDSEVYDALKALKEKVK